MEKDPYLLVMRSLSMQTKFQPYIQPYLVLYTTQADTLTYQFYTEWIDGQEVISTP